MNEKEGGQERDQKRELRDVDRLIIAMHNAELAKPSSVVFEAGKENQLTELFYGEDTVFAELDTIEEIYGFNMLKAMNGKFYENRRSLERKLLNALTYSGGL